MTSRQNFLFAPLAFGLVLVAILPGPRLASAAPRPEVENLRSLAIAAERGDFQEFHRLLVKTRLELGRPAVGSSDAVRQVLAMFEDLEAIWSYRLTDPMGSFFNDDSLAGRFSALAARYADYLTTIRPQSVMADGGERFYPTVETQAFLLAQAVAALERLSAPSSGVPKVTESLPPDPPQTETIPSSSPAPIVAVPQRAVPAPPPSRPTAGRFEIGGATRAFNAPLFGGAKTEYRLSGNQLLENGANITLALFGGFPSYTNTASVQVDRIPLQAGLARIDAGDFLLEPLQLNMDVSRFSDSYVLEGARAQWRNDEAQWGFFAGRSKYSLQTVSATVDRISLFGVEYARAFSRDSVAVRSTLIRDSPRLSGSADPWDVVTSGTYVRTLSPWAHLFSELHANSGGALGGKLGSVVRLFRGSISAAFYTFGDEFPLIYPLYRPGEQGFELNGSYRPSEFSFVYGNANYVISESRHGRSDLRGTLGFLRTFGSNLPTVDFSYSRDQVTHGLTSDVRETFIADRVRLGTAFASNFQSFSVVLEHLLNQPNRLDRTQLTGSVRRVVAVSSVLHGSMVIQQEGGDHWGATAEGILERPLVGMYSYLTGLGAAYIDRPQAPSGEGVVRLGITRRAPREGWYLSVEARLPFSLGLSDSGLNQSLISIDIGNRYGWKDLSELRNTFAPLLTPEAFGGIEGSVTLEGKGIAGLTVRVNGSAAAVTTAEGFYRIHRVPVGPAVLSVDTQQLEPGYAVSGGPVQEVMVTPRSISRGDFQIARFSTLQGALVRCEGEEVIPLASARLALISASSAITLQTSSVGGFQTDEIPPDIYDLIIEPSSVVPAISPEQIPRLRLDLTRDVLGQVIRIGCDSRD